LRELTIRLKDAQHQLLNAIHAVADSHAWSRQHAVGLITHPDTADATMLQDAAMTAGAMVYLLE